MNEDKINKKYLGYNKVFLEESDTSMTRGLEEELSVDEEDPEDTIDILNDASESLNINTNQNKDIPTKKRSKTTENVTATYSSSVPKSSTPTSSRSAI